MAIKIVKKEKTDNNAAAPEKATKGPGKVINFPASSQPSGAVALTEDDIAEDLRLIMRINFVSIMTTENGSSLRALIGR